MRIIFVVLCAAVILASESVLPALFQNMLTTFQSSQFDQNAAITFMTSDRCLSLVSPDFYFESVPSDSHSHVWLVHSLQAIIRRRTILDFLLDPVLVQEAQMALQVSPCDEEHFEWVFEAAVKVYQSISISRVEEGVYEITYYLKLSVRHTNKF